jgi:hypothetical protein
VCGSAFDGVLVVPTEGFVDSRGRDAGRWQLVPVSDIEPAVVDLSGRCIRAPSRYVPERLAASRCISEAQRRVCFNRTLDGQHRCFCCLALLVFTMEEEFQINRTAVDDKKVRCHEAGHCLAHSLGKPVIGDHVDEKWNLIPLCHSCNVRMGRQNAFAFIEKVQPTRMAKAEIRMARAEFERMCPAQLK